MSLWDPEAAGNAACFLRLTDMQMLEIRNKPFEGTKAIWVPNTETGYIKGEIVGEGDKPNTTKVNTRASTFCIMPYGPYSMVHSIDSIDSSSIIDF